MRIIIGRLIMRKKSYELQWLEVLNKRNELTTEEKNQYQRLQRGYFGEKDFDKMCQFFLTKKQDTIDDITLKCQTNTVQIDKIIASANVLYIIDEKFYRGAYQFQNNQWIAGSNVLTNNIYEQLRRAVRVIKKILHEENIKMDVKGILSFINPESEVQIIDNVEETTLSYAQIVPWLITLNQNFQPVTVPGWKRIPPIMRLKVTEQETILTKKDWRNWTKVFAVSDAGSVAL